MEQAVATMGLEAMMTEIRELASTRRHHLAPHMLGTKPLSNIQAAMVLAKLRTCPSLPGEAPPVHRAPAAAPPPISAFKSLPPGYYATPRPGTDIIDYWLIEEGKGKWEGYRFARRVLGGQPKDAKRLRSERLENMQQRVAMQKITAFGIEEASKLFADTLERCIDCSTPLTNDESRARRRGKWCQEKLDKSR